MVLCPYHPPSATFLQLIINNPETDISVMPILVLLHTHRHENATANVICHRDILVSNSSLNKTVLIILFSKINLGYISNKYHFTLEEKSQASSS